MITFLKEFFFPKFCLNCKLPGTYLCSRCFKKIPEAENSYCYYCKKESNKGLTHFKCLKKFNLNGVFSLFEYNSVLRDVIHRTKFLLAKEVIVDFFSNYQKPIIDNFGFLRKLFTGGVFVPIPSDLRRYRYRGFNLAQIISENLGVILGFKTINLLEKIKNTSYLSLIENKKTRKLIIKGSFKPNWRIYNKTMSKIILIDDLVTTGSTLSEAASTLKKAGVELVFGLTLARKRTKNL